MSAQPNFDEAVAAAVRAEKREDRWWGFGCGFLVGLCVVLGSFAATATYYALRHP
jgi:hypothetical protein